MQVGVERARKNWWTFKSVNMIFLQVVADTTKNILPMAKHIINNEKWLITSIVELGVIGYLTAKLFKSKQRKNKISFENSIIGEARETNVDMENIILSINQSTELYKKLSHTCHPDKFANTEKEEIADKIFQNITRNKRNYKALLSLKEQAIEELGVTIN